MVMDAPRMGLHVTRDPSVWMKSIEFHAAWYGRIWEGHLCMSSRVWRGMGPYRPDCCQDRWGRLD